MILIISTYGSRHFDGLLGAISYLLHIVELFLCRNNWKFSTLLDLLRRTIQLEPGVELAVGCLAGAALPDRFSQELFACHEAIVHFLTDICA